MHRNCSTYTTCKFSGLKRKREVSENNEQRPTKRSIFDWQGGATRRTEICSATYITHGLIGSKRMRDNSTQASEDSGQAAVEETTFNSSTPIEQYKEMCTSKELEGSCHCKYYCWCQNQQPDEDLPAIDIVPDTVALTAVIDDSLPWFPIGYRWRLSLFFLVLLAFYFYLNM
ncbi:hypothetical protein TWF788_010090 [Orbilia oligospora]|uniref:Uncharacterized protein n=1 Tax=Orbilia oligospora TaxID=2813651 RepID=A0A7C8PLL0_ORBOL|nr:hypothetical protein TWF788_010090 [Orbilia oligospora]